MQNGWLPPCVHAEVSKLSYKLPVFVSHGDFDPIIAVALKEVTISLFREYQLPLTYVQAWVLNHSDALLIRRRVLEFLCDIVPKTGVPTHRSSSYVFPQPDDMHSWSSNFRLNKYNSVRGLI